MISIIEREIVDKHHWIEKDDFLDLLAIAQSLPGILAVNIATAVGEKLWPKGTPSATNCAVCAAASLRPPGRFSPRS